MNAQVPLLPIGQPLRCDAFDLSRVSLVDFRFARSGHPASAVFFQCPGCGTPMVCEAKTPVGIAEELEDAACCYCRDVSDPRLDERIRRLRIGRASR